MNANDKKGTLVRCAIYTRRSTADDLMQFQSPNAQRKAAEAFVESQAHADWVCLPERYDDDGFNGGDMDRPALKRLLVDIEAGRVDVVVVDKVSCLSRSLPDFAGMIETFEKHCVSFATVAQPFHSATELGRFVCDALLYIAKFERKITNERTRDRKGATA